MPSSTAPALRPFQQLGYARVPDLPRRPHPFLQAPARTLELDSAHFGRMAVHYREAGEGEPLLLVHGLMTTSYSWRYVWEALSARYRVIAPDLPGAGRTDKPTAMAYTPVALARWLGELQGALGLRGCLAVGNSMGGYLAMRHALDDPGAFRALVNIHSPGLADARMRALHAALRAPGARRALAWWVRRDPLGWAYRNVHYYDDTLKSREEAREYGAPLATRAGARAFVRYLGDAFDPRAMDAFARTLAARRARGEGFPAPLLLLYSTRDPLVPPALGPRFAALIPDARLVRLAATSHFAHVDSPERVGDAVLSFFADLPPAVRTAGSPPR